VPETDRPLTISLLKIMPGDDVKAFLEVFESTADVRGWPHTQWAVRLLPLLTGEGLSIAHGLPAAALQDWLGLTELAIGDASVGGRHPTVFSGPRAAGRRRPVAAPRREELPAGVGGGGQRGLSLGFTPVNS